MGRTFWENLIRGAMKSKNPLLFVLVTLATTLLVTGVTYADFMNFWATRSPEDWWRYMLWAFVILGGVFLPKPGQPGAADSPSEPEPVIVVEQPEPEEEIVNLTDEVPEAATHHCPECQANWRQNPDMSWVRLTVGFRALCSTCGPTAKSGWHKALVRITK